MIYDLVYQFYQETDHHGFKGERDMINALTVFLKKVSPDNKRVIVITKHKHGAWWMETIIVDGSTYHFNDYKHWRGDMTEEEAHQSIQDMIANHTQQAA